MVLEFLSYFYNIAALCVTINELAFGNY